VCWFGFGCVISRLKTFLPVRFSRILFHRLLFCLGGLLAVPGRATPVDFNLPAQPLASALLLFAQQARVEVLYSYDDLKSVPSSVLVGRYEPDDALNHLLKNTGFAARRNLLGKFVVTRTTKPTGSVEGRILTQAGEPARRVTVALAALRLRTLTDETGAFVFPAVPPGTYRLVAGGTGYQLLEQPGVLVEAGQARTLGPLHLQTASEVTELEPYLVRDQDDRLLIGEGVGAAPRRAAGNLDLPRTEDNALPFTIFTREQIARSGVVQLNEFFQRELLDGDSSAPPEQNGQTDSFISGSSNLNLRGYGETETVVLVNGRRLPETITDQTGQMGAPDVNLVPLSLVQQVEVLPVSASALYSGNAVGGVINIVLSPAADGTEVRTTYTNALGGFNAPQSSVSLQHSRTLLGGALRLRLNATFTQTEPAVESEFHYQQARLAGTIGLAPRATPNVASTDGSPLFGPGSPSFTSVAPGADGTGGLAAFDGRQGVLNRSLFDTPAGLASSFNSSDYVYGREQRRMALYGSAVYDVRPWLQLGIDATYASTVVHRGYDLFESDLTLPAGSPFNPFHQPVHIVLNEIASRLGPDYSEAQLESYAVVASALLKLPAGWQVTLDGQYANNVARYRGLLDPDPGRWQEAVDAGQYNPLRDPQVFGAPDVFYDRVLVYYGGPGRFVTMGDYDTFQGTARVTHEGLELPTGKGTVNGGVDYGVNRLAPYTEERRFADGTPAADIVRWSGRTLERMSVFGELQAPLVPAARLPRPLKTVELDLAARYTVSTQSNETNLAPTFGLKMDFTGGFSFRGSYTTSNRFPTPIMSRPLAEGSGGGSPGVPAQIFDPLRRERYEVETRTVINPNIRPEAAATQTAGLIWRHGKTHRFRASLDFADTTKTNEIKAPEPQAFVNNESSFPDRVLRTTPPPGPPPTPDRITTVLTGTLNAARRHSQNWSAALDYSWNEVLGGTLELRGRWVWYQRYDHQLFATSPVVDELNEPDGFAPGLLRHRLSFGTAWSNPRYGFGIDAHYLSERILPRIEWPAQGSDHIKPYWQFDAFAQADLTPWLPGRHDGSRDKFRLTAQLRVNNLSNFEFPKYVNDASGAGVQPYGDWRGRTFSFSLTASF